MTKRITRHKKKIVSVMIVLALLAGSLTVSAAETGEIKLYTAWPSELDTGVYRIKNSRYNDGLKTKRRAYAAEKSKSDEWTYATGGNNSSSCGYATIKNALSLTEEERSIRHE